MSEDENIAVVKPRKGYRRILAMMLLSAFVLSWFVWGPLGGIFYVGGLFNSTLVFVPGFFLFLLVPVAAIGAPILLILTLVRWSKLDAKEKWWHVGLTITASAFAGSFALGFIGCMPSAMEMYMRGFARYVDHRSDVAAIQNWLGTLDPNDYKDPGGVLDERPLMDSEQPASIARLHPKMAKLLLDDSGRLAVRLLWGGGMTGHWGIMVGHENMPMPLFESDEPWLPLRPGAYVWSSD